MRHSRLLTLFILFSVVVSSCENAITDYTYPDTDRTVSAGTDGVVSKCMRIKVSEEIADILLQGRDAAGNVTAEALSNAGFNIEAGVESLCTSFMIGGRFEKRQREEGLHLWFDVTFSEDIPATKSYDKIISGEGITLIEPVYEIKRMSVEMNDPYFLNNQLWHYENVGQNGFREDIDIDLTDAWEEYGIYGNSEVVIAVVDSGVEYSHEDLNPNMWTNEAELNGLEGVDDDGNGYKDDIYGYNFVSPNGAINFDSHGTHVAGTIAAVNNNGIGVCGVAGGRYPDVPGVRVMALQVIDDKNPDASANLLKVYQYAADNGAVILNNSWGYAQTLKTMPKADQEAIDYFIKYAGLDENGNQVGPMKGGMAIFAAGNSAEDLSYPAAYEKVMAVAAVGPTGKASYYTNYGEWVDVCAPGGDLKVDSKSGGVFSIGLDNTYAAMQGTSMACPHVTGIAALVLSASGGPGYTSDDLWDAVITGTDPSIYDYNQDMVGLLGVGMVSATLAMSTMNMTPPEDVTVLLGEANANTVYLTADVPLDDSGDAYYYHVYYTDDITAAVDLESMQSVDVVINKQELLPSGNRRFPVKGLDFQTEYLFAVVAGDFAGNKSSEPCIAKVTTKKNTLPVINVKTKGKTVLNPSETSSYVFEASDPDDFHFVTCSFDPGNTTGMALETLMDGSYHIKIDASKLGTGQYTCAFVATDQFGGKSTYEIQFEIKSNSAPVINGTIRPIVLNGVDDEQVINLFDYFSDPDGDILMYSLRGADDLVKCNISNGKLTVKALAIGKSVITVTATDPSAKSIAADVDVYVRNPDKPYDVYPNPVVDILNIGSGEDVTGKVILYSSTGQKSYENSVELNMYSPYQIDLSGLAPGRYRLVIDTTGSDYETDIIKL